MEADPDRASSWYLGALGREQFPELLFGAQDMVFSVPTGQARIAAASLVADVLP
jgi:hypothetical protein